MNTLSFTALRRVNCFSYNLNPYIIFIYRTELMLHQPDIPIRNVIQSLPDSSINQYLNFAPSDRYKDAAQSTVPFLDVQSIVPNPSVPIAGAGLFHKGNKGSGGFLALKLITYDFSPHLQIDLPPAPPILEKPNEINAE